MAFIMGPNADFVWPPRETIMTKRFHLDGQRDKVRREVLDSEDGSIDVVTPQGTVHHMKAYRKTAVTYATQIPIDFEVDTLEGLHSAHAGDYYAIGAHGEAYPIAKDIFEETYEEVPDGE
jgi:hypothetical protein